MGKTSSDDAKEQALRNKTNEKTEFRMHMIYRQRSVN